MLYLFARCIKFCVSPPPPRDTHSTLAEFFTSSSCRQKTARKTRVFRISAREPLKKHKQGTKFDAWTWIRRARKILAERLHVPTRNASFVICTRLGKARRDPGGFQPRRYGPFPDAITVPLTHVSTYNYRHIRSHIPPSSYFPIIVSRADTARNPGWTPTSKIRATPCRFASSAFPSKIRAPRLPRGLLAREPPRITASTTISLSFSSHESLLRHRNRVQTATTITSLDVTRRPPPSSSLLLSRDRELLPFAEKLPDDGSLRRSVVANLDGRRGNGIARSRAIRCQPMR